MALAAILLLSSIRFALGDYGIFEPPCVESVVSSATSDYAPYITFQGDPTATGYMRSGFASTGRPVPIQPPSNQSCSYWVEDIQHQGVAPFHPNASYQVFRNVKDFGAQGDGVTDDTAAINLAISSGGRCAPGSCESSTISPAVVYLPPGTYLISSSIIDFYYTQIIGNANCMPTLKATADFVGFGLIDGDVYGADGLSYGSTNVFWRQVRNLIFDTTGIPSNDSATCIHWPTAQATSLQNCIFNMSQESGTQHQGIFIESGSGGFINDLVFYGGLYGANMGNQQFTMRNLTFYNSVTAINQIWDWGWTYKSISINNCTVGLNMSSGGSADQSVGSVTFFDSSITNTSIGIITAFNSTSQPATGGSLILENVHLNSVSVAVQGPNGVVLAGTTESTVIEGWGQGHAYRPTGPVYFEGPLSPNDRPTSLISSDGKYYERSKPQYETFPVSQFLSARSLGATGDGATDDTVALQSALYRAAQSRQILFIDAGDYIVTSTLYVPPGSKIVGESYSVIIGSGVFFGNMHAPRPIIQVGRPGDVGAVEWSDMIVSTQGPTKGAILIEWNLDSATGSEWGGSYSTSTNKRSRVVPRQLLPYSPFQQSPAGWNQTHGPSGMWDVHARIGGFAGSDLQLANCPTTPDITTPPAAINEGCIAAFMTMHITSTASSLYLENVWLWTADHDVEDANLTQITVFAGRGLLVESTLGGIWLVGTAVEHHTLYQYQFVNTQDVWMGQIQTETAYYQPNPPATIPFPPRKSLSDPVFALLCGKATGFNFTANQTNSCNGYGLRILDSTNLLIYGAGLYSFFDNYNTTCSAAGQGEGCQSNIFSIESGAANIDVYNLNTVGSQSMITLDGVSLASYADNVNSFPDTIALFRLGTGARSSNGTN